MRFKEFEEGEAHVPHRFVPGEAGWCLWGSCFSPVAGRGKRKVEVDPGGDSLMLSSNHSVIV